MGHHSLVDELESHALAVLQADRLGLRVLLVIDGPEIALHVAGQADLDLPRRLAHFIEWPLRLQIGIGEEFATVGRLRGEAAARRVERVGIRRRRRHGMAHRGVVHRSEEHTSELQSLMRISYAVFCLKTKKKTNE